GPALPKTPPQHIHLRFTPLHSILFSPDRSCDYHLDRRASQPHQTTDTFPMPLLLSPKVPGEQTFPLLHKGHGRT
ncbi:unnamed protein product, partial [Lota lota]